MKNENLKFNKTKFVARLMLVILLLTTLLNLSGCIFRSTMVYDREYYSHEEFVNIIEHYNSVNNGSVDTFISFDLDFNDNVSNSIYRFSLITNNKGLIQKYGFLDIYDEFYRVKQLYYLNDTQYKILYHYDRNQARQEFKQDDKMEIRISDKTHCNSFSHDLDYHESFNTTSYIDEEGKTQTKELYTRMYNYAYYCELYINDMECGCIHISSKLEMSTEKFEEIFKLLLDNIVIIGKEEK